MNQNFRITPVQVFSQSQTAQASAELCYVSAEDYNSLMAAFREANRLKQKAERKAEDLEKVMACTQAVLDSRENLSDAWSLPHPIVATALRIVETRSEQNGVDYQAQAENLASNIEFEIQHFDESHTPLRLQSFANEAATLIRQMPKRTDFHTFSMKQFARLAEDLTSFVAMDDDDMTYTQLREMLNKHNSIFEPVLAVA